MSAWSLEYEEWAPEQEKLREALCTLGNGVFATRGAREEAVASEQESPGTYIAGAYNRLTTEISGRNVENEDLVNWPNWLPITFRHEEGEWLSVRDCTILEYAQTLDMRRGVLERRMRIRDGAGRTTTLQTRRLVSMAQPHIGAIEWSIVPEDWEGPVLIRSEIDGAVTNSGVPRYSDLNGDHLRIEGTGRDGEEIVYLVSQTVQSWLRVAQALRHRLSTHDEEITQSQKVYTDDLRAGHEFSVTARKGAKITLEKICALHTHRDHAITEPLLESLKLVKLSGSFEEILHDHVRAWERLWDTCDMELDADEFTRRTLRLHIFHLLQTVSMNSIHRDIGVPARGWHGEAYRGHIFWDELFIFPFLTLRIPEITRTLLMYRYRRLPEAKRGAAAAGHAGAMFPWQSGSNGREESQTLHLNPRSGRWNPDSTHLQRHINGAIAYNVWQYYQATSDEEFLSLYGAEMILEIARFWGSIAQYNEERGSYDIRGVVGPDEYHTKDPRTGELGLTNNAYTNVIAAWTLRCVDHVFEALPDARRTEVRRALDITDEELERWSDISRNLYIPFHDGGVISQFEGYEDLEEFDWERYQEKYEDIQRLDRVLEAENDSPDHYKASKQADVLMLFFLFSDEELAELFEHMGYEFRPDTLEKNIAYYRDRTSHGSTLSRVVFAWVLARSERSVSWNCFKEALRSDVEDIQGGTTEEGIHLGAMSGTVDLVQRCYSGVELREDTLWVRPQMPDELNAIEFPMRFRGHSLLLRISRGEVKISSCRDGPHPIKVAVDGEVQELREGQTRTVRVDTHSESRGRAREEVCR